MRKPPPIDRPRDGARKLCAEMCGRAGRLPCWEIHGDAWDDRRDCFWAQGDGIGCAVAYDLACALAKLERGDTGHDDED